MLPRLKATLPPRGASQLLGPQQDSTWNSPGTTRPRPWWEHHVTELMAKGPRLLVLGPLSFSAGTRREPQRHQEPEPRTVPHHPPNRALHTWRQYSWPSTLLALQHPVSAPPGGTQAEDAWQRPLGQEPGSPSSHPLAEWAGGKQAGICKQPGKGGEKQGGRKTQDE